MIRGTKSTLLHLMLWVAVGCAKQSVSEPPPQAQAIALAASPEHSQHAAKPAHEHEHHVMPGSSPSADSLYQLQVSLRDQDGQAIGLDYFRGHVVLAGMFYASCTSICPMLVARVKSIEAQLEPEARKHVKVLLVSLDPARDDPPALKRLALAHAVDQPSWRFAVGSEDATREIAAVLGVRYRELIGGEINHTPVIAVLDAQGTVRSRTEDFGDSSTLLAALATLSE